MVTPAQTPERYFASKPHRGPGGRKGVQTKHQSSPKAPLTPHNSQPQRQQPASKPRSPPSAPRQAPHHPKPTSPKPIMNPSTNHHHHQSPSPPTYSRSSPHHTPSRSTSTPSRSSPNNFASSTVYQPPTPSSLPKPPLAWTQSAPAALAPAPATSSPAIDPSAHLRLLLNVNA